MNIAYIQNINYYKECTTLGLDYPKGGTVLLKMIIQYLRENKNTLNIKYIQLRDTSHFYCNNVQDNIDLCTLYMFTHGETWYGKYGFTPYYSKYGITDIKGIVDYNVLSTLVKILKLKNTDIEQTMINAIDKHNIQISKKLIKEFCKIRKDYTLINFFKDFININNFSENCRLFYYIYKDVMADLKLPNLYGISYYLTL